MGCDSVEKVLVFQSTNKNVGEWNPDLDIWWHDIVDRQDDVCEYLVMDSEDVLFILYTSGFNRKSQRCCAQSEDIWFILE